MHVTVSTSPAQPSPTSAARTMGRGGRMVAPTSVAAASALRCALDVLVAFYSGARISSPRCPCTLSCMAAISPCSLRRVLEADGSRPCPVFCQCGVRRLCLPGGKRIQGLAPFLLEKGGELGPCCQALWAQGVGAHDLPRSPAILSAASCSSCWHPVPLASLLSDRVPQTKTNTGHHCWLPLFLPPRRPAPPLWESGLWSE